MSRIEPECLKLDTADRDRVLAKIESWLAGDAVNNTENRPAMHMALRASKTSPLLLQFVEPVLAERDRQKAFVNTCTADNILHVGVGGSDFGPRLITDALSVTAPMQRRVDFLSTLTPEIIQNSFSKLNAQKDLILFASKSFATDEILYILNLFSDAFGWPMTQTVAMTALVNSAKSAGFSDAHIFPLWSWVGGRFSVWSSVGMPIALAYGWDHFESLLAGGEDIDRDLIENREKSLAFRLAVILHQERRRMNRNGLAILPYHYGLRHFPAYLQQLIMESNGKPGDNHAPIVFGQIGTEFQHSFGQFLHQGPDNTLSLFIDVKAQDKDAWAIGARQRLSANAHAQADTLWTGAPSSDPHKQLPGGRPSLFLTMSDLGPRALGNLLALFEHATVIDGFLSGINPFDQWGVEAGKVMAQKRLGNGS